MMSSMEPVRLRSERQTRRRVSVLTTTISVCLRGPTFADSGAALGSEDEHSSVVENDDTDSLLGDIQPPSKSGQDSYLLPDTCHHKTPKKLRSSFPPKPHSAKSVSVGLEALQNQKKIYLHPFSNHKPQEGSANDDSTEVIWRAPSLPSDHLFQNLNHPLLMIPKGPKRHQSPPGPSIWAPPKFYSPNTKRHRTEHPKSTPFKLLCVDTPQTVPAKMLSDTKPCVPATSTSEKMNRSGVRGSAFSPEEDSLLLELRNNKRLTYLQMTKHFDKRSRGTLSKRFYKVRPRASPIDLKLKSTKHHSPQRKELQLDLNTNESSKSDRKSKTLSSKQGSMAIPTTRSRAGAPLDPNFNPIKEDAPNNVPDYFENAAPRNSDCTSNKVHSTKHTLSHKTDVQPAREVVPRKQVVGDAPISIHEPLGRTPNLQLERNLGVQSCDLEKGAVNENEPHHELSLRSRLPTSNVDLSKETIPSVQVEKLTRDSKKSKKKKSGLPQEVLDGKLSNKAPPSTPVVDHRSHNEVVKSAQSSVNKRGKDAKKSRPPSKSAMLSSNLKPQMEKRRTKSATFRPITSFTSMLGDFSDDELAFPVTTIRASKALQTPSVKGSPRRCGPAGFKCGKALCLCCTSYPSTQADDLD